MYGSRCSEQHNLANWTNKRASVGFIAISVADLLFNLGQITLFLSISFSAQAFWSSLVSYEALLFAQSVPQSQLGPLNAASVEAAVTNGRSLMAECLYYVRSSELQQVLLEHDVG